MSENTGELDATQAALAAEHAAVYGYGVVGGRIGEDRGAEAREAHAAHRSRRDQLYRAVRDLGGAPVAAAAGYALPFEVSDSTGAVELAVELETRLAGAYADLVLATTGEARKAAAAALREAAVRAARWRGHGEPFPGLAEYADGGR
ncbi:DUF4439 domain-containing protein [Streptomyces johnsoniae]|uniref:DUF4439 domain-containing protein n=1 Tax=Streptomyces johnsoniae TaxID=3075532 RepID=A0ABU2RW99_9ACTN|nr:DUF4439 domain-containing protein [Streptomyces sp. DSM 41886]MDT0441021.1 DUF4439 domain-containing protein [Streptomyces sp. DSM 41886]